MSTIPKDHKDEYSKHVKKIDPSGNLKPHPRVKSVKREMKAVEKAYSKATPDQKKKIVKIEKDEKNKRYRMKHGRY